MFHVEHCQQETLMKYPGTNCTIMNDKLDVYAKMINESKNRFNLTGLKTINEIQSVLITESLLPFAAINVPRGTLIADIGTGAGIPGIPLSILLEDALVTMFDATQKKIEFIKEVIKKLDINNAGAICGRVEELGKTTVYRESYDWVTTRAMADPYLVAELGAPLLKTGGYLYLYTSEKQAELNEIVINHISELGLAELKGEAKQSVFKTGCGGLLFTKIRSTDIKYPRRINAIKRDISNILVKEQAPSVIKEL